jgi:hypothetical protein
MTGTDGFVAATDRNLVAERRARLEVAKARAAERAAGRGRVRGRKTGDPRLDRQRNGDAARARLGIEG